MNHKIIRRAFNAGELSPLAKYRNDVEKHSYGCLKLENFYVSPLGAVSRREGTRLLSAIAPSSPFFDARLLPFEYSSELAYNFLFYADTEFKTPYIGRSFVDFPDDAWKISISFQSDETPVRTLFKSGNMSAVLFYDSTSGVYLLQLSDGSSNCSKSIGLNGSYEVDISYKNGKISFEGVFDNGSELVSFESEICDFNFLADGSFSEPSQSSVSEISPSIKDGNSQAIALNSRVFNSTEFCMLKIFSPNGVEMFDDVLQTPIPVNALKNFQFKQVGGYFFIAHPSIPPQKLSLDLSTPAVTWENAVKIHPSLDLPESYDSGENITADFTCEDSSLGEKDLLLEGAVGTLALKASASNFTQDLKGSQLKLEYLDEAEHTYKWKAKDPLESKVSAYFAPAGKIEVILEGGNWDGVLLLEESTDGGKTWSEIGRSTSIQASSNEGIVRESFAVNSICRVRMMSQNECVSTDHSMIEAHKEGCFFNISTTGVSSAWVEVLEVADSGIKVKLLSPARNNFKNAKIFKGSWNSTYGFPRTVDIHEERLVLAGTRRNPHTVWLSQTNNWDIFRSISNLETDPLAYTLAADEGEPICWINSADDLMIGTASQEWSLGSRDSSQSLSASIVAAKKQSEDGSEYLMPARAGGMLIYVKRGFLGLESIQYDFASDSYGSISLVTMHPDILKTGVKCVFNQLSPQNRIYCVKNDGEIAVFTYDKENNVAAWGRLKFGDGVIAASALSQNGLKSVFLVVSRGSFICLERLDPEEMGTKNYLDCVPVSDKVYLPHLLAHSVKYESYLQTTPLFLDENAVVNSLKFPLLNSGGGEAKVSGYDRKGYELKTKWQSLLPNSAYLNASTSYQDYQAEIKTNSGFCESLCAEIRTDDEAPFTLLAVLVKVNS